MGINETKYEKYWRSLWGLTGGIVGFLGYSPLIPDGIKLIFFLAPMIIFSFMLTGKERKFNYSFFAFLLLSVLLFSSSFISLDASYTPSFSQETFHFAETMFMIENTVATFTTFIIVGIPALLLTGAIWAIIVGRINEGVKALLKVSMIIVFVITAIASLSLVGVDIFGISDGVLAGLEGMANSVAKVVSWANPDTDFASLPELTAENPRNMIYAINAATPLIISFICFVFALLFLNKKFRVSSIEFFDKQYFSFLEDETKEEMHLLRFNYRMLLFGGILSFSAFMMFLNFKRIYDETGILNFSEIGYLSIYAILMIVASVALSLPRYSIYTKSNLKNTVLGTIMGLAILFLSFQFLSGTERTLSAYGYEYNATPEYRVLNTFIFVAPAESLFFHVGVLAFGLGWMYHRADKNLSVHSNFELKHKIETREGYKQILVIMKADRSMTPHQQKQISNLLRKNEEEIRSFKAGVSLKRDFLFEDNNKNSYILFCLIIFIANFAFSTTHWVLSDLDFFLFWMSGLGIIYFVGGCLITFVGWRFGWLAAIMTHALYNTWNILGVIIITGG
jgi:hypothetical protein